MKKKVKAPEKPVATLEEEDRIGLNNRHSTMLMQQQRSAAEARLAEMAGESYNDFMRTLREKYELGDEDDIDLATGEAFHSNGAVAGA